jgi:hypothetical protein
LATTATFAGAGAMLAACRLAGLSALEGHYVGVRVGAQRLGDAALLKGVAVNQILGGTAANELLNKLFAEYEAMNGTAKTLTAI